MPDSNPPRPVILIIDDNPDQLEILLSAFRDRYKVLSALDGLDGYALACSEHPSAIILDIAMPLVDGWTVLRKLRANQSTKDIPVVIFTALEVDAVSPEAKALGVRAVLRKPTPTKELEAVIRQVVRP